MSAGGAERSDSIQNALALVKDEIELVAVHDAARPVWLTSGLTQCLPPPRKIGAAILAVPVPGTLKQVDSQRRSNRPSTAATFGRPRRRRSFRRELLGRPMPARDGQRPPTTRSLVEQLGQPVTIVEGSPLNSEDHHPRRSETGRASA